MGEHCSQWGKKSKGKSKGPCEVVLLRSWGAAAVKAGSIRRGRAKEAPPSGFLGGFNNSHYTWVPFVRPLGMVVFIKGFCGVERGQGKAGVKDCWCCLPFP